MPCCNNSEKGSLEFWKNKSEKRKMCENGKMYMKKNGIYFNLDKWIFVLQFTVPVVPLIKENVPQLFLQSDLTIIFH
jgi:hypothetical protein